MAIPTAPENDAAGVDLGQVEAQFRELRDAMFAMRELKANIARLTIEATADPQAAARLAQLVRLVESPQMQANVRALDAMSAQLNESLPALVSSPTDASCTSPENLSTETATSKRASRASRLA